MKAKNLKTVFGTLALTIAIATGLSSCPSVDNGTIDNGDTEEVVSIDANLPMTGDLALWGSSIRDGATMALEELEASDPDSVQLQFDWQDNAGSPQNAVSIFQQQFLDAPDLYVSGLKPATMAIKDQIDERGTPHFLWIFDIGINEDSNNNFRTLVNYKIEAAQYLKYAEERQAKRVAIVYILLPHAEEQFQDLVIPGLQEMGVEEIFTETYELGVQNYRDIAVKVQEFDPDLIILNGFQNTLVGLIRALRSLELIEDGNTIGTYDTIDAAKILSAEEMEGIRAIAPLFETRPDRENVASWKERFRERYDREPIYIEAFAYDMVGMIYDAATRLELPATSEEWIAALRETNIECVTGNSSCYFDEDGDLVTPIEIGVFQDGKLVPDSDEADAADVVE